MILYHGSYKEIKEPDLQHTREDIDFGAGFYLTPDIDMAKKWACAKRNSVVTIYEVDTADLSKYQFGANYEWLEFVKSNRRENGTSEYDAYDMLIGPTADDKLYLTLQEYLDGDISAEDAVEYLNIAGFSNQYVFKNEEKLKEHCHYLSHIEIKGQEKFEIKKRTQLEREAALEKLEEVKQLRENYLK